MYDFGKISVGKFFLYWDQRDVFFYYYYIVNNGINFLYLLFILLIFLFFFQIYAFRGRWIKYKYGAECCIRVVGRNIWAWHNIIKTRPPPDASVQSPFWLFNAFATFQRFNCSRQSSVTIQKNKRKKKKKKKSRSH